MGLYRIFNNEDHRWRLYPSGYYSKFFSISETKTTDKRDDIDNNPALTIWPSIQLLYGNIHLTVFIVLWKTPNANNGTGEFSPFSIPLTPTWLSTHNCWLTSLSMSIEIIVWLISAYCEPLSLVIRRIVVLS